ncbi:NAD(P)H-dependent glycerol-3-phosphate dehydrogenase [Rhodovibrio salinarum]|uniref:Glycerol-3-phosphate dehydrogenase [NAD(P)+] n=1 Tax=Rhodovibrio salinarum TaxID=1087 RepID=A0A934QHM1_9PROT|nr:NAD(P)H-dependent glycerol-3-phosphate dehydrogenase [Rhodovibrio salinarum]MBK1697024.1 NAD(P)-dependent glycerol-3-phosphate dehydrogenase [Rhodovibrio salinarum]
MQRFAVIGGGAWGTGLAQALVRAGREVTLWVREREVAEEIAETGENRTFLPDIPLSSEIWATPDLEEAVDGAQALLLAVPAQHLRAMARALRPNLGPEVPLVICAKGIEDGTLALMSEVLEAELPGWPLAVLSGPTFAVEVARGQPAAVTLATRDPVLGDALTAAIGSRTFRPYLSDDVVGAEIGGAVKNVIAIACGIVDGRALGENARAALITRGLAEVSRLAFAKGARAETVTGLSGLGDLTLTCVGAGSRNHSLGVELGKGRSIQEILGSRRSVAEGVFSARATVTLAEHLNVEMPIAQAVDAVVNQEAEIAATIDALLARPLKSEHR